MNSIDLIRMGLKNLWRRKLRTFLTVLGVIIGTSSIIVMLSLGFGMKEAFTQQIKEMGNLSIITVNQGYNDPYAPVNSSMMGKQAKLDKQAVLDFSKIKGVQAVTPVINTYIRFVDGKYSGNLELKGIDPNTMKDFDFNIQEGRLLNNNDKFSIVFGGSMNKIFIDERKRNAYGPPKEPKINLLKDKLIMTFDMSYGSRKNSFQSSQEQDKVKYENYKVKGVGILKQGDYEKDYSAFMPIEQVKKIMKEKNKAEKQSQTTSSRQRREQNEYQSILVKVKDIDNVKDIQTKIEEMGFNAYSLNDYLETASKTSNTIQAILGGIGAVSLLVAAIGITNTMVMSIYERTKEIGVMKVIGASLRDIKRLFLFEAGTIGLLGGILGVVFSYLLSFIINNFGTSFENFFGPMNGKISIIPLWLIFASLGFTTAIGLISGYYPAKRAMKLSALEAIKTE